MNLAQGGIIDLPNDKTEIEDAVRRKKFPRHARSLARSSECKITIEVSEGEKSREDVPSKSSGIYPLCQSSCPNVTPSQNAVLPPQTPQTRKYSLLLFREALLRQIPRHITNGVLQRLVVLLQRLAPHRGILDLFCQSSKGILEIHGLPVSYSDTAKVLAALQCFEGTPSTQL